MPCHFLLIYLTEILIYSQVTLIDLIVQQPHCRFIDEFHVSLSDVAIYRRTWEGHLECLPQQVNFLFSCFSSSSWRPLGVTQSDCITEQIVFHSCENNSVLLLPVLPSISYQPMGLPPSSAPLSPLFHLSPPPPPPACSYSLSPLFPAL